ncbi:phosphoethanolamine transferase [Lysobacter solisilvae (ex Woo and Kim 2020)]|uniref:Phosphoethanolamine--lipid A transferase n=1 Tax=Agrilutibacter terrestris TaxID=2865112 RepID=A0A7H0G1F0_9GAMM|nr:phosphoethanolamine--lipid A transferase [Lysobacter terrestris]
MASWGARAARYRPELSVDALAIVAALYFALASNGTFFRAVAATGALDGGKGALTAASLFVAITALHTVLLGVLLNRWTAKPLLTVLLLASAAAAYFMAAYTVYFDADMLRNILHTDGKESHELISFAALPSLLLYGVLPAVLLWRVRLKRRPLLRAVVVRVACIVLAVVVAAGALLASFQSISALMRNHRELRYLVTPGNYLVSLAQVAHDANKDRNRPREPVGTHAKVVGRPADAKPRLLVLVVGETVRAQNWGLNGYARQTTPQLAALAQQPDGPANFRNVSACGSATEVSLPCMFSMYGRANYDKDRIKHSESLLHVLEHAGIKTLWRDNQTGCKGVCEGLAFESFEHGDVPGACSKDGCLDEAMLHGLAERIAAHPGDQVVVLHQLGNHGPAYYARYPARLRRFVPTCDVSDLNRCSREQIVNAYDNAVLSTDDFIARTIAFLGAQGDRDTALIYLSDHGESLGENGLYLHGVPYAIAPATQTRVPLLVWLSPRFAASRGIDTACLKARSDEALSQDNLFSSVLGLMQVRTPEYTTALDLFARCEATLAG